MEIDFSALPSGVYIINVETSDKHYLSRFIKQ
ncbi:MAG: T9SS type A sorting domain-containing protein [Bacteroidetes bacterium]|nr:T9SS type A sorting domain-containing protein [Bacteroidota bacterium]